MANCSLILLTISRLLLNSVSLYRNLWPRCSVFQLILILLRHRYLHIFILQPMYLLVCNSYCRYSNAKHSVKCSSSCTIYTCSCCCCEECTYVVTCRSGSITWFTLQYPLPGTACLFIFYFNLDMELFKTCFNPGGGGCFSLSFSLSSVAAAAFSANNAFTVTLILPENISN